MSDRTPLVCARCEAEFPYAPNRKYCSRACQRLASRVPTGIKAVQCLRCGFELVRGSRGPVPRWCMPCRRVVELEQKAAASAVKTGALRAGRPCRTCGDLVASTGTRGPIRSWCDPCTKVQTKRIIDQWLKDHPEIQRDKWRAHKLKRRAQKKNLPADSISPRAVFERDNWVCGICRQDIDPAALYPDIGSASVDHIVPLSHGGHHVWDNVQAAHWLCNSFRQDGPLPAAG